MVWCRSTLVRGRGVARGWCLSVLRCLGIHLGMELNLGMRNGYGASIVFCEIVGTRK